jgi:CubicO group peptidase (beta-lactamase class C family)
MTSSYFDPTMGTSTGTKAGFLKSYMLTPQVDPYTGAISWEEPKVKPEATPGGTGPGAALANGAGGIVSSNEDLARFYLALQLTPNRLNLTAECVQEQLFATSAPYAIPVSQTCPLDVSCTGQGLLLAGLYPGAVYAQGVLRYPQSHTPPPAKVRVSPVFYFGSIAGYTAGILMWPKETGTVDLMTVFSTSMLAGDAQVLGLCYIGVDLACPPAGRANLTNCQDNPSNTAREQKRICNLLNYGFGQGAPYGIDRLVDVWEMGQ